MRTEWAWMAVAIVAGCSKTSAEDLDRQNAALAEQAGLIVDAGPPPKFAINAADACRRLELADVANGCVAKPSAAGATLYEFAVVGYPKLTGALIQAANDKLYGVLEGGLSHDSKGKPVLTWHCDDERIVVTVGAAPTAITPEVQAHFHDAVRQLNTAMPSYNPADYAPKEKGLKCGDGSISDSCTCSGSHKGCCSHHGGVAGCTAS